GPHRHPVRAYRPLGAHVAPCYGRGWRASALPRHGDRAVPGGVFGDRGRWAAAGSTDLPLLPDPLHANVRGDGVLQARGWTLRRRVLPRRGLQLLPPNRLRGPGRRLRAAEDDGRDEAARY